MDFLKDYGFWIVAALLPLCLGFMLVINSNIDKTLNKMIIELAENEAYKKYAKCNHYIIEEKNYEYKPYITMTRAQKLMGCPICGKKPTIEFKWTEKDGLSVDVVCKDCDLRMHVQDEDLTKAVDVVIEKWNNRAV